MRRHREGNEKTWLNRSSAALSAFTGKQIKPRLFQETARTGTTRLRAGDSRLQPIPASIIPTGTIFARAHTRISGAANFALGARHDA